MMTKRLAAFLIMAVMLIPFTIQAETALTPSYDVALVQPAVSTGLNKPIAMAAVESAQTMRSLSQIASAETNAPKPQSKPSIGHCGSCHSNAEGVIGVSGGDSIGIKRFS